MELLTKDLILRTVNKEDIKEIARMWEYPKKISLLKAHKALKYMESNHSKNAKKAIYHLCLGVFQKCEPNTIIGWCGLDGKAEKDKTVLFYIIDENYRNKGFATQCASALLGYAFEEMDYDIIYGGCAKSNAASYKVMSKSGMTQSAFYENGDYIFSIDRQSFLKIL